MKRLKLIVALCILLNVSIISSAAAVLHPDGTRDYKNRMAIIITQPLAN